MSISKDLCTLQLVQVKVQYIDFGNISTIPIDDLLPIDFVDPTMHEIRPQVSRYNNNCMSAHYLLYYLMVKYFHRLLKLACTV